MAPLRVRCPALRNHAIYACMPSTQMQRAECVFEFAQYFFLSCAVPAGSLFCVVRFSLLSLARRLAAGHGLICCFAHAICTRTSLCSASAVHLQPTGFTCFMIFLFTSPPHGCSRFAVLCFQVRLGMFLHVASAWCCFLTALRYSTT